jgi:hypothetical protein
MDSTQTREEPWGRSEDGGYRYVLGQVLPSLAGDGMRGGLLLTAPVLLGQHRYENSASRREIRRNSFVH